MIVCQDSSQSGPICMDNSNNPMEQAGKLLSVRSRLLFVRRLSHN